MDYLQKLQVFAGIPLAPTGLSVFPLFGEFLFKGNQGENRFGGSPKNRDVQIGARPIRPKLRLFWCFPAVGLNPGGGFGANTLGAFIFAFSVRKKAAANPSFWGGKQAQGDIPSSHGTQQRPNP